MTVVLKHEPRRLWRLGSSLLNGNTHREVTEIDCFMQTNIITLFLMIIIKKCFILFSPININNV